MAESSSKYRVHQESLTRFISFELSTMPPKGGNAKKEGGRAKKAENEAKKKDEAAAAKVHASYVPVNAPLIHILLLGAEGGRSMDRSRAKRR